MFPNDASEFIYTRTYSRWIEELKRRETWPETVERYLTFIQAESKQPIPNKVIRKIRKYILNFEVMPSMRAMWSAGLAAKASHVCFYNCSFCNIDSVEAFAEALYILMCGAGFGFKVTEETVNKLPTVQKFTGTSIGTVVISDNKEGWADSVKTLMNALYEGKDVDFDYSLLRPKGARLMTMGGRSSGPAPLISLHQFIRSVFSGAQGRKLTTLECHDIVNVEGEIVVVGGVRRSSEISLSDLNDLLMRGAKTGNYPLHRAMANNSAIYKTKPTAVEFLNEWASLAASGTGERGIFNLEAIQKKDNKRRDFSKVEGTNPCGEILLRDMEFCNLSEVIVKAEDEVDDLLDKVEAATWIGAIQSQFTDFPYLRKEWKENCDEERLLGVSLSGQMDNPEILTKSVLKAMKAKAIKVAKHAASILKINVSTAITCVKPSGTVSQLCNSASGLHPRFSRYYIRRYRISAIDPLYKLLNKQGTKLVPEVGQDKETANTWVVEFPIAAPKDALVTEEVTALEQLEHYKKLQENWCEHNSSITVFVKDNEWFEVGNWVYQNWDIVNGIAFLPADGGKYQLAPYESITKEKYEKMLANFVKIDYSELSKFEMEDGTVGGQSYSCLSGVCELN